MISSSASTSESISRAYEWPRKYERGKAWEPVIKMKHKKVKKVKKLAPVKPAKVLGNTETHRSGRRAPVIMNLHMSVQNVSGYVGVVRAQSLSENLKRNRTHLRPKLREQIPHRCVLLAVSVSTMLAEIKLALRQEYLKTRVSAIDNDPYYRTNKCTRSESRMMPPIQPHHPSKPGYWVPEKEEREDGLAAHKRAKEQESLDGPHRVRLREPEASAFNSGHEF